MDARRLLTNRGRGGLWCQQSKQQKASTMPATLASNIARQRRGMPAVAVVVGEMEVADSDDDSEDDDLEVENDDCASHARIVRVVAHGASVIRDKLSDVDSWQPSWHALLRRTPNGRTASITRAPPPARVPTRPPHFSGAQGLHLSPSRAPSNAPSRIVRADPAQRPPVNVPAKVLTPRAHSRILFHADHRARCLPPLPGPQGPGVTPPTPTFMAFMGRGRMLVPGPGRHNGGAGDACGSGRFRVPGAPSTVAVARPGDALSSTESAILEGVLDMIEAQKQSSIQALMRFYGVRPDDPVPDVGPILV